MKENEDLSLDKTIKYSAIIKDHLFNEISITDSYLRMGSDSWCELVNFYRENKDTEKFYSASSPDKVITGKLETGKPAYYKDSGTWKKVRLDLPQIQEHKAKKFVVYRKTLRLHEGLPVAKAVRFGSSDPKLQIKNNIEARSKSFWARHRCDLKVDKDTAGWWSCYSPELFGDILKLKGGKNRW